MKKTFLCLIAGISAGLLLTACRNVDEPATPSAAAMGLDADRPGLQDHLFVTEALASTEQEIAMGLLGVENASNLDLRLLSQRMHDDHAQAKRDLLLIADQRGISLEPAGAAAAAEHVEHLAGITGEQFDRAFLEHMTQAHEADIRKFEAAARSARSPDVRAFAARTLPVLREHLRIAQNIRETVEPGDEIEEAAGAERPSTRPAPYYRGNAERPHQFDNIPR